MGRLSKHRIKNAQCTETQSRKHNFAPADKWAYRRTSIAWARPCPLTNRNRSERLPVSQQGHGLTLRH